MHTKVISSNLQIVRLYCQCAIIRQYSVFNVEILRFPQHSNSIRGPLALMMKKVSVKARIGYRFYSLSEANLNLQNVSIIFEKRVSQNLSITFDTKGRQN